MPEGMQLQLKVTKFTYCHYDTLLRLCTPKYGCNVDVYIENVKCAKTILSSLQCKLMLSKRLRLENL